MNRAILSFTLLILLAVSSLLLNIYVLIYYFNDVILSLFITRIFSCLILLIIKWFNQFDNNYFVGYKYEYDVPNGDGEYDRVYRKRSVNYNRVTNFTSVNSIIEKPYTICFINVKNNIDNSIKNDIHASYNKEIKLLLESSYALDLPPEIDSSLKVDDRNVLFICTMLHLEIIYLILMAVLNRISSVEIVNNYSTMYQENL